MSSGLEHSESATAAATAIRNVCSSCGTFLAESHLDVLLQLYQKVQGQGAAAPAGAQKLQEQGVPSVRLSALVHSPELTVDV